MSVRARWLGQAGFLIEHRDGAGRLARVLVDPYLSDSLARKYVGTVFPHTRMHPPPVRPHELPELLAVLCTHAHTDHMDPDTLTPLLTDQPTCRLVAPRAVLDEARRRSGLGDSEIDSGRTGDRIDGLADGAQVRVGPVRIVGVAAAHEERERDANGDDRFLGYVIEIGDLRVYHSGDCTPRPGLAETVTGLAVDVALLPVNGRDDRRRQSGVPGNFTFAEALELCDAAGVGALVPHHWGMFDFNTVDPAEFALVRAAGLGVRVEVPALGRWIDLGELGRRP